jgi:hypothetical protein
MDKMTGKQLRALVAEAWRPRDVHLTEGVYTADNFTMHVSAKRRAEIDATVNALEHVHQ